jgi:hypothetical protein
MGRLVVFGFAVPLAELLSAGVESPEEALFAALACLANHGPAGNHHKGRQQRDDHNHHHHLNKGEGRSGCHAGASHAILR